MGILAPAAPKRGKVAVIGGGPAGMEAARVCGRRGRDVVLFEARPRIGGQMNLWAELPGREIFATTPHWYEQQLKQLGVDIRLGVAATPEIVAREQPDAILVATGSS